MRRWRRDLETIRVPEPERQAPVCRGKTQGTMRVADRLGRVGRAGAKDEHDVVTLAHDGRRRWFGARTVDCPGRLRTVQVEHTARSQVLGEQVDTGPVGDREDRSREADRLVDLERFPGGVEEHGHRAELAGRMHCRDELGTVGRHDGDAIAGAHAQARKVSCRRIARPAQLREGPAVGTGENGRRVGESGRR